MMRTRNESEIWRNLCLHIRKGYAARLQFVIDTYRKSSSAASAT